MESTCAEYILHPLFLAGLYLNSVASACDQNGLIEKGQRGTLNLVPLQRRRLHLGRVHFQYRWTIPIDAFVAPTATRPYFRHGPCPLPRRALIWRIAMQAEQMRSPLSTNLVGVVCRSDRRQTGRRPHHHLICHVSLRFRSPFSAHR